MSKYDITNWTSADDAQVEEAIRRGASRRDVLRLFLAGGASLAAGSSVFTRATAALAASPVKGGHFKAAGWSSSTSDTLDPAKASLSTDYVRCCALYNRLTFLADGGKLQMELAEAVDSSDAKTWTVKLKSGVTFHDGKTLTADDVVYSLKRHLDKETGSKVNSVAKQMEEIKAIDLLTVQITLEAPNADLPTILAMHHFMIVQDGTIDFSKGIGTGAFKLENFEPGVRSLMNRNENYFKPGGPNVDSFEYFAISDEIARVNAVISGDIHVGASVKPQSMRLLESQTGVDLVKSTSGNYTNLNMRKDMAPGEKADFIEGVKYLLNRELIQKSVMRGLAEIANDQPISPSNAYHNKDLKPRDFDPEKAKHHFEKAGLLGQSIPVVASEAANASVEMATLLQQAGSDIGMNFDVQRVPSDGYWSNYWLKAPVHFGNINPRPTPDILFSLLYAATAPWNESRYESEKFDTMLLEARGELDFEKRKAIYDEMQVMISEEAGTAIPVYLSNVDAKQSKVKGLEPNPLGGQMGYAMAEYVWIEA
ncbi:Putative ABC transporter, periplasmic solute-binding protein [Roseibium aggregatum IAM 12614]|uniref:Putative ABC transporter, periplasmic solute-binding protein n=1 Tax=Roseibium aggregatum (strain ATCC 25650 / DSM 13394 / JCM 20685 / NBRC 16684 / NCIMB 2208 / IAM 12614 / B1) TaxID=384765 RepID=A0NZE0_ROSAI|nr:ABC transporter substrate-binding protein [Roseibium aggregatum]EAV41819.1 Putative ABC transporter, periplasmic solute-binding protein [Roseibium aggregatum IAM 12614]